VVAFGGSCALAFTGAGWWIVVFELLVVVGVILLVLTGTFLEYRLVVSDDETYRVAVLPSVDVGFPSFIEWVTRLHIDLHFLDTRLFSC
jgi:hypothetical protein